MITFPSSLGSIDRHRPACQEERAARCSSCSQADLAPMIRRKVGWFRLANVFFALGTVTLAELLMVIVWKV